MYSDEDIGYVIEDDYNEKVNFEDDHNDFENYNEYDTYKPKKSYLKWILIGIIILIIIILLIASCNNKEVLPYIKILEDEKEVKVNEVVDLNVDLKNNDNTNLEWQSFDEDIATVDSKGEVTGIGLGKTKVLVTYTHSNGKQYNDDCFITVYQGSLDVLLRNFKVDEQIKLKLSNSGQIKVDFDPVNAYVYSVKYHSLNETIASVTNDGIVTANGIGETEIMVTVNEVISKNVKIIVYKANSSNDNGNTNNVINPSSVKFNDSIINIMVNETQKLNYTVLPKGAKDYTVNFENSNNTVLRVNKDGTIKGLSMGTSTVTVKINNTIKATILVKVNPYIVYVDKLILKSSGNLVLNVGDSSEILYEVSPSYASNKIVTFTSSNPHVATVDTNGVIKAVAKGNCIIILKTVDGNKTIGVNVVVN